MLPVGGAGIQAEHLPKKCFNIKKYNILCMFCRIEFICFKLKNHLDQERVEFNMKLGFQKK